MLKVGSEEEEEEVTHQKMIVVYDCCMQSRHLYLEESFKKTNESKSAKGRKKAEKSIKLSSIQGKVFLMD